MSNTIFIKGMKLVETAREVTLPVFFKHNKTEMYVAIYQSDRAKVVSNYPFSREVRDSTHVPDIGDSTFIQVSEDDFMNAYRDCVKHIEADFTTNIPCT